MRTHVIVLAIAMLVLPSALLAQRSDTASSDDDRAPPVSDPTPRQAAAPRSLMGTVMTILIESAERSGRQATERAKAAAADSRPSARIDPAANDQAAAERVAVQAVP